MDCWWHAWVESEAKRQRDLQRRKWRYYGHSGASLSSDFPCPKFALFVSITSLPVVASVALVPKLAMSSSFLRPETSHSSFGLAQVAWQVIKKLKKFCTLCSASLNKRDTWSDQRTEDKYLKTSLWLHYPSSNWKIKKGNKIIAKTIGN